jgi:hypothetical protein
MKADIQCLHHSLKNKLGELNPKEKGWIEKSFHVVILHWEEVKKKIAEGFVSSAEEIDFFKTTKHFFTAEMEYYSLRFHAALFEPVEGDKKVYFWEREKQRFPQLVMKYKEFYDYYLSGKTCRDEQYFLRKDNYPCLSGLLQLKDEEKLIATPYDLLVTEYIAGARYHEFVKKCISVLNK